MQSIVVSAFLSVFSSPILTHNFLGCWNEKERKKNLYFSSPTAFPYLWTFDDAETLCKSPMVVERLANQDQKKNMYNTCDFESFFDRGRTYEI